MLSIRVTNARQDQSFEHTGGPVELGRGPRRRVERIKIEDSFVSRDQLQLEELPDGRVRLENLSQTNAITVGGGEGLPPGGVRELLLPVRLAVGQTQIDLAYEVPDSWDRNSLLTINQPVRSGAQTPGIRKLADLGETPAPETLAHWLETLIGLQGAARGVTAFHAEIAQALVNLIGLDVGMVLLRHGTTWEVASQHAVGDAAAVGISRTLLNHVVAERRTFFQEWGPGLSPAGLNLGRTLQAGQEPGFLPSMSVQSGPEGGAVVVSPIFGLHDEVAGALYGLRRGLSGRKNQGIRPLEAQVVQLLAAAVGANLARTAAARTRVQFEQFFSAELVRELERDPNLLEGREQEVTILVSDLRGFSGLSERLGPQTICRLLRDLMERLSERIVEHGGVIVDYAGDGLLAMWNAPAVQEDHRARACRAALAMLDEMPGLNAQWQQTAGTPLAIGIGLNTGPAQVGNTGSSRKFKYGPLGHTVNLAARVQEATKKLRLPLMITAATRQALPAAWTTRRLGQYRLTGIAEGITLFELRGEPLPSGWAAWRDAYEAALTAYENRQWARACQTLLAQVELTSQPDRQDTPTLKLLRRAWDCLETPPEPFDPVMVLEVK
jgi:adenylate cyclase